MGEPAAQAQGRGVDRLLAQRAEALPLERHAAILHLAAHEEGLEPVVDRAREHHPAQQLAPLRGGQGGGDGFPPQEPVAHFEQFGRGAGQALARLYPGRGLGEAGNGRTDEPPPQRLPQGRAQGVDGHRLALVRRCDHRLPPRVEGERERVGILLGHERPEARAESRPGGEAEARVAQGSVFQVSTLRRRSISFSCSARRRRISSTRRSTAGGPSSRMKSRTSRCASSA